MKSHISIFFFLATLLAVLCISPLSTTPEEQPALPENCALCTVKEYPNLSLLDLSTGAAQELKVYNTGLYSEDLMYYVTGEFSREQPMGTMELVRCAGLEGVRFTGEYPFASWNCPHGGEASENSSIAGTALHFWTASHRQAGSFWILMAASRLIPSMRGMTIPPLIFM